MVVWSYGGHGDVPAGFGALSYMPLRLRVFEERYLIMLAELLKSEDARFGVVLIERGREVGGGEHRFGVGTIAEVRQLGAEGGFVGLIAQGGQRFEVTAVVGGCASSSRRESTRSPTLSGIAVSPSCRTSTEQLVRRTLAMASEFAENIWPADVELSDNPIAAAWQLAAIAPINALDQVALLRSTSARELLARVAELTRDAALAYEAPWLDDEDES